MTPTWIEYKNKKILYVDYKLLSPEQIIDRIYAVAELLKTSEEGVLVLSDFTNVLIGIKIVEEVKVLGQEVFKNKTIKSAVLGVTGIKKMLLVVYGKFSRDDVVSFDVYEDALEYLVS